VVEHGVSGELVSAGFPAKQGKYRDFGRLSAESSLSTIRKRLVLDTFLEISLRD
jgi:hypothetical protein